MRRFLYYFNKILKKIRFSAISKSEISSTAKIESGCLVVNSSFGRYSFCGYDCNLINVDIGGFCSIASKVSIGGAAHPLHFVSTSSVFLSHKDSIKKKFAKHIFLPEIRTKIGNDVWVGEGAYIKAGVRVGSGAVIGMGSVVTKDVPPYAIVAGNPAVLIRYRFSPEVVEALSGLQWWNMSDSEISAIGHLFDDPQKLLKDRGLM